MNSRRLTKRFELWQTTNERNVYGGGVAGTDTFNNFLVGQK